MSGGNHVNRSRLTNVVEANRVTVVEAGAGFGKSALAAECADVIAGIAVNARLDSRDTDLALFVSRLRRAFRLAGLSDLAAATQTDPEAPIDGVLTALATTTEPVLLVLDDVHNAESDDLAAVIVDLASSMPAPHRLLVLGRNLAGTTQRLRYAHGVAFLAGTDLAFTKDEASELLGGDVDEVMRATDGWPAAVILAARHASIPSLLARISQPHNAVVELVQFVLSDLTPDDCSLVVQLAHLPLLSPRILEALADDGAWPRLTAAGLPFTPSSDGFVEFPGPVQDYLVEREPFDEDLARAAAAFYCDASEIRAALDVLLSVGDHAAAAAVIADFARRAVPPLEFSELASIVESLGDDAVLAAPRVLLVFARLAGRADRQVNRYAALTRLESLLPRIDDARVADEFCIEVAHDLLRLARSEEAKAIVAGIDTRLGSGDAVTRAQLLTILGRCACRAGEFEDGIRLLNDATQLALQINDRDHAAVCTYALATEAFFYVGRLDEALEVAKQSLALSSAPFHRLARINLIADFATDLGRYEDAEAALAEQVALLQRHRFERWAAYVPWGHARIASQTGNAMRTRRAIADVERFFEESWFEDRLRAYFLGDAADMLARVGENGQAVKCLEEALAINDGYPNDLIDAIVEARIGDAHAADAKLVDVAEYGDRRESSRIQLFRAFAALRRSDPAAGSLAADAFDSAAADGLLTSLVAREPTVTQQLVGLAAASGSLAAGNFVAGELPWSITLFGGFEVRHGGQVVTLPPGKPAQAVKLVAAAGGRATLDDIVDALWPDQDLETGRRGVRNLLNRLKAAAPDLLLRDGNDLVLPASATVDAAAFEAEARAALQPDRDSTERTGFARAALIRYHGELLPSDRYEPWATLPRERARRRFSELIDLLIDDAEAAGEIDEAVRLCERAIEIDPYDDTLYTRATRLLLHSGRRTHARAVVVRARAMLAELGVEPIGELEEFAAELDA